MEPVAGGAFKKAIYEELYRLAQEGERQRLELLLWDGRGWEHPSRGWRRIFRGAEGGK